MAEIVSPGEPTVYKLINLMRDYGIISVSEDLAGNNYTVKFKGSDGNHYEVTHDKGGYRHGDAKRVPVWVGSK